MKSLAAAGKTPGFRAYRLFLLALAAASLITLVQYVQCAQEGLCPVGGDFSVFYRAASLAVVKDAAAAYDLQEAHSWFNAAPGTIVNVRPFLNPPISLLMLYPLGFFSQHAAFVLWCCAQLLLLLVALRTPYARRWLYPGNRADIILLVFPFALYSIMTGQSGMLSAGLFLLALATRASRPVAGAAALACLFFKPQMGLLLPVLLLKERRGRMLTWAAGFVFILAALSVALWGTGPWQRYGEMLGLYRQMVATAPPAYVTPSASAYMAMRMLGAGGTATMTVQACLSLTILLMLWKKLGPADEAQRILLLTTATFLISPYSFIYDTVLLLFACLVLLGRCAGNEAGPLDRVILMLLAFIPLVGLKIQFFNIPYTFAVILFAFLATWLRIDGEPRHA